VIAPATFERHLDCIAAGEPIGAAAIRELAAGPDILGLGMLADALRRRTHGTQATYLRVAHCGGDSPCVVPPAAQEVLIAGSPDSLDAAVRLVSAAASAADGRTVSGFSWTTVEALAGGALGVADVLSALRDAGLDAIAGLPLDAIADPAVAVERLAEAGFRQLRLTIEQAQGSTGLDLLLQASDLQAAYACIQTMNPLPARATAGQPTTGYEDVRMVALARLAAPDIPTIQIDWMRYGPKLAQVALTFGADDLYGVSASDEAPEGRRRAAVEEVRRNIEAAGFEPRERDGRFVAVG